MFLNSKDKKIYEYLCQAKVAVGATQISRKTALSRQSVYKSLGHLQKISIVKKVPFGKFSKFSADNPTKLDNIFEQEKIEASLYISQLKKIYSGLTEQESLYIEGIENIIEYEILRAKKSPLKSVQYLIVGGTSKYFEVLGERYNGEYAKIVRNRQIYTKYLGSKAEILESLDKRFMDKKFIEYKVLDKFPVMPINIMIFNDTVSFYSFVNPYAVHVIKSKIIAKSYLDFFNFLWNTQSDSHR